MSAVAERISYQQPKETSFLRKKNRDVVGSEAFNLEYDAPPTRNELRRDIISYLGEYRLQVQKYDYMMVFGRDKDKRGPITLRDRDRGEAMAHKTKRVIEERTRKGDPTHREEAEDRGIALLNDKLRYAQTGDTVVWASPPGPKDQGYGEYGFLYVGKVDKLNNGEARLAMSAIRIENPTIEQYNDALTALIGEDVINKKADQFLSSPTLIKKDLTEGKVAGVLQKHFAFTADVKQKEKSDTIIAQMEPLIEEFLDVMEVGNQKDKLKLFHTLENYALKLKEESEKDEQVVYRNNQTLGDLSSSLSYAPPVAKGSCGSSGGSGSGGGMRSNSLTVGGGGGEGVMSGLFGSDRYGSLAFNCPSCGKVNVRKTNEMLERCGSCGSKEVGC